jgi:23S rRNA (guanosine2251-2'-O)-methyltransferase
LTTVGTLIYGIHPVWEALRAGQVEVLRVSRRDDRRLGRLLEDARRRGVPVRRVDAVELARGVDGGVHQGVVAELRERTAMSVSQLLASSVGPPLVVVLDGIEDPRNLGAIVRSVDAAGAGGIVRQSRRAARLGGAAAKASAGAVAFVTVAEVVNVARAIDELKEAGVWTIGLAGGAPTPYDQVDYTLPTAFVVGAEGVGLRRLVRERCDRLVSIPMHGHVQSLNVSVAAGVVLFEAVRQRRSVHKGPAPVKPDG